MFPHETAAIAAASAATLGLLAGGVAYSSRWPTSQLFGQTLIDAPEPAGPTHTVALTYDDGPSERNTPALLDLLEAAGVPATFFLIGQHARRHPALVRRITDAGHVIGNHTEMHPALARKSAERIRRELVDCQTTLLDITGVAPTFFRPPYGSRRPAVLRLTREIGLTPVMWNITARDWKPLGPGRILRNVERGMAANQRRRRTSNVLLHDASNLDGTVPHSRADTLAVTAQILRRPDLRFVSIAEIARLQASPGPARQHGGR